MRPTIETLPGTARVATEPRATPRRGVTRMQSADKDSKRASRQTRLSAAARLFLKAAATTRRAQTPARTSYACRDHAAVRVACPSAPVIRTAPPSPRGSSRVTSGLVGALPRHARRPVPRTTSVRRTPPRAAHEKRVPATRSATAHASTTAAGRAWAVAWSFRRNDSVDSHAGVRTATQRDYRLSERAQVFMSSSATKLTLVVFSA